jgi:hypothetical protein
MPTDTLLTLKLPEGYTFADLKLRRCESDAIDLDMDLVKLICKINALDFDKVLQNPGPVITSILTIWYKSHLAEGGQPDALPVDAIFESDWRRGKAIPTRNSGADGEPLGIA